MCCDSLTIFMIIDLHFVLFEADVTEFTQFLD